MVAATATFSAKTTRAAKSRLGVRLSRTTRILLVAMAIIFAALGLALVAFQQAIGWTLIGVAALPLMVYEWWRGELHHVPSSKGDVTVDGVMSSDLLGQLSRDPSPQDLARAASSVPGGMFFAIRFGMTRDFLLNITSEKPADTQKVWQYALEVREITGSDHISGAVLAVALFRSFEQSESLLAHMHLDIEDFYAGIRWYEHRRHLFEAVRGPHRTGGIARDFSFGYPTLIKQFARNLSLQVGDPSLAVEVESHQKAVQQLIDTFGSGGRQNAVLVGPAGVGKTTIVQNFSDVILDATSKIPESLRFRQIFILDSGSLIAAAPGRGELEGLVMHVLAEAYTAKNIILCLDNAQLFFEEGVGSVDLTNVLLPILEAGNVRIILTMDEQRYLQISQRNPGLVNAMNRITITPATKEETMAVMQDQLIIMEYQHKVSYSYKALQEAYRLSERYVHDLVMPGRAVNLLESAAGYDDGGLVTPDSVQKAIEQVNGVKVGVATDDDERQKLLGLEDLIHKRMINQSRAVTVVSDALRRARAGVRNENRPIGTFLFLGPTGVGKTELSKALAEVYFGGEGRMVRLDMNEFVRPEDVARLIADGADDPSSLTAQVIKAPFSVVLLDEIEKAHPQVLTTLLQLLDEGILRDIKNREVSFRDAIVIATSNAGADRIREHIEKGDKLEDFEEQFVDELISSNQFRPEFLNRFDEIVIFRPLDKPELLQVIDLILAGINKTMALQKISVHVAQDAKEFLVEKGYDPRLGARPMRRVVQRAVENLVAKLMLSGTVAPGSVIEVSLADVQSILGSELKTD